MVGVARIELATPAMSTQAVSAEAQIFAAFARRDCRTPAEHNQNRANFHRSFTGPLFQASVRLTRRTRDPRLLTRRLPLPRPAPCAEARKGYRHSHNLLQSAATRGSGWRLLVITAIGPYRARPKHLLGRTRPRIANTEAKAPRRRSQPRRCQARCDALPSIATPLEAAPAAGLSKTGR